MLAGGWIKGIQGLQVDPNHPSYSGVANHSSNESPVSLFNINDAITNILLVVNVDEQGLGHAMAFTTSLIYITSSLLKSWMYF